ncbi:hypothetical protein [Nocardia jinanensis]|uniref:Ig-like domain-containing protein n=1 Tax=Nocardia jinanensis TaxID=382504 RepID=A0A917VWR6_9NOCA|nr:hypothetical protein [Nocardia jinanensis]GGL22607.1 hypothetical protein GCM10011588_42000 [Nocardia jinanensis]
MAFAVWVRSIPVFSALLVAALSGCASPSGGDPGSVVSATAPPGVVRSSTVAATSEQESPDPPPTTEVSLVAVDASGQPADGFVVSGTGPVGELDCTYGTSSRSATSPGIYHCGASADAADVCWAGTGRRELFCADDPWSRELRWYRVDTRLEPVGKTANPEPWALELADGRKCRIRVGGAWGGRADGLVGAYSCTGGAEVVLQPSDARTAIDTSAPTWHVSMGELGAGSPDLPPPTIVDVRTAYFAAAP